MIPKTLHYCWFGKGEKPKVFTQCLESWKQFCPDFEIKEWNEATSKKFANPFYKNALRKKQYAFAADCIRVNALMEMGGIYLDTDMLLVKPIEPLLAFAFFTGYEIENRPAYGFFGARPGHPLLKAMADFYTKAEFDQFSPPVITHTFKNIVVEANLGKNDKIFPPEYFYPLPYQNKEDNFSAFVSENTYAVHLWDHSWKPKKEETLGSLLSNLATVVTDYVCYGYSYSYFKRYFREFARKLYHRIFKKNPT
ncbi:alpha 1,4-glycosyltransferase [Ulvibacter sp. MAR_2010_11]|uniref:glycosyltransferase n=1 Tax=Ulvibacter sp. MAR_2010_11 TaxID=1250229 RepID=UPI000C2BAF10|nr:glycosyltransferase [Ulvibacter sp. MAR_2010_11]PKA82124.1 alpha 1,4-glycosyltransferase [Ulvibacter sp. MAR_2010_11]